MNRKSLKGSLLLLLGSVIWGAAFAAQRAGMDSMGPFAFNGIRMLLAGIVLIPVAAFLEHKKEPGVRPDPKDQRKAGLLCGVLLFVASSLQQMGLVTTTAGKAGFITALYVVLVPVAAWLLFRKNPGRIIWLGVVLAVFALYLLCMPAGGGFTLRFCGRGRAPSRWPAPRPAAAGSGGAAAARRWRPPGRRSWRRPPR